MTTELEEKQFELDGVVFGLDAPLHTTDTGFKPDGISWRTQDGAPPEGDAIDFGRDFLVPGVWGWELFTIADEEEQAYDDVAALERAWRAAGVRDTPQAVLPLRYCLRGKTRVIYGRPGRFTPSFSNLSLSGNIPVTCDFRRVDTLHYEDVEESKELSLVPSTVGGLQDPIMDPLTSLSESPPRTDGITIGGDAPTWVTVEFAGEQTRPRVEVGSWVAQWDGSLAWDRTVTIDPRPWRRNVRYDYGGSAAGKLNRRTNLQKMLLAPGEYTVLYSASVAGGSAAATLRWRNAYSSR